MLQLLTVVVVLLLFILLQLPVLACLVCLLSWSVAVVGDVNVCTRGIMFICVVTRVVVSVYASVVTSYDNNVAVPVFVVYCVSVAVVAGGVVLCVRCMLVSSNCMVLLYTLVLSPVIGYAVVVGGDVVFRATVVICCVVGVVGVFVVIVVDWWCCCSGVW